MVSLERPPTSDAGDSWLTGNSRVTLYEVFFSVLPGVDCGVECAEDV